MIDVKRTFWLQLFIIIILIILFFKPINQKFHSHSLLKIILLIEKNRKKREQSSFLISLSQSGSKRLLASKRIEGGESLVRGSSSHGRRWTFQGCQPMTTKTTNDDDDDGDDEDGGGRTTLSSPLTSHTMRCTHVRWQRHLRCSCSPRGISREAWVNQFLRARGRRGGAGRTGPQVFGPSRNRRWKCEWELVPSPSDQIFLYVRDATIFRMRNRARTWIKENQCFPTFPNVI